ncbi:hypothetical protein OF83DRAFT_628504 [Amylostereum chailletii]|nr:hypothetical protein OF83DRAFT_628504 [Amylostereum chailletii]
MHLEHLLYSRQNGCVDCPNPPACQCQSGEQCVQTARSCNVCPTVQCVAIASSSSGSGVSAGAVAGAVVGAVLFLVLGVGIFFWWRRRNILQAQAVAASAAQDEPKDVPAPAETVLNRPDPSEKPAPLSPRILALAQAAQAQAAQQQHQQQQQPSTVRVYDNDTSVIDLDPTSRAGSAQGRDSQIRSVHSNPFGDTQSIMTTSTGSQSTNVIPIALVPPGTVSPVSAHHAISSGSSNESGPMRPQRSPLDDLNMDHLNVSRDSVQAPSSMGSRLSQHSYLTTGSFSSDVLTEAPVIITQSQRQVLGSVKAEVIHTPGSGSFPAESIRSSASSRPPVRSPLANAAFGPQDIVHETDENASISVENDPFSDERSPLPDGARSSRATFGTNTDEHWHDMSDESSDHRHGPPSAWQRDNERDNNDSRERERPLSSLTQAASVIGADIMDATRVHLGFATPTSASLMPNTPMSSSIGGARGGMYRMTSGRLVTPSTGAGASTMERQQERAMLEVQAAREQQRQREYEQQQTLSGRMSMSTMASGVSMRADSILESFPFVPPSPISNLPSRTPPRSPLSQQTRQNTLANGAPRSALGHDDDEDEDLPLPDRRMLGMSTGSELSSISTGLGSFPFQIDHGNGPSNADDAQSIAPPSSSGRGGRVRASLDTLALTADLSSYPLGFDKQGEYGFPPPLPNAKR